MFELCFLLAHWQRWNLTSLIFIPLDLVGLVASLWLIVSAIKGILNPSEVSRNRTARGRASQHASEPQLLTALLAKARGTGPRLAPEPMSGFSRNRQFDRLS